MFKILVADDEENIRNLFRLRLESEGYEVFTAENGAAAMDILYREVIDLVIADVMMPVINGFELVRRMREEKFDVPVIFHGSGYYCTDHPHEGGCASCPHKD